MIQTLDLIIKVMPDDGTSVRFVAWLPEAPLRVFVDRTVAGAIRLAMEDRYGDQSRIQILGLPEQ